MVRQVAAGDVTFVYQALRSAARVLILTGWVGYGDQGSLLPRGIRMVALLLLDNVPSRFALDPRSARCWRTTYGKESAGVRQFTAPLFRLPPEGGLPTDRRSMR